MTLAPLGAGEEYEMRPPDPFAGNWDIKTLGWRLEQFDRLGFDADQAEELAAGRTWHGDVENWLRHGCSHAVAYAIAI